MVLRKFLVWWEYLYHDCGDSFTRVYTCQNSLFSTLFKLIQVIKCKSYLKDSVEKALFWTSKTSTITTNNNCYYWYFIIIKYIFLIIINMNYIETSLLVSTYAKWKYFSTCIMLDHIWNHLKWSDFIYVYQLLERRSTWVFYPS